VATRREFVSLSLGTGAALTLRAQTGREQKSKAVKSLRLAKVFENTYLVAASPDGRKIAITRNHGNPRSESLAVIDLDTWKELGSIGLLAPSASVSFFGSGESLYAETVPTEESHFARVERIVLNLTNWSIDRCTPHESADRVVVYQALKTNTLAGAELTRGKGMTGLVVASLPNYEETVRVPFSISDSVEPNYRHSNIAISTNADHLAYGSARSIICRRISDLGLVWTREVEQEMFGVRYASITPDGRRVAVAVMDTMFVADQRNFYVGVFDAQTGSPIARLHLNGTDCMALSPDGKLIAVENRRTPTPRVSQPVIEIYDIDSGLQIAEVIHDSHLATARDFGFDQVRADFSADGKYLITSTTHTKVWALEPSATPGFLRR